jgi:putative glutamine amidotransferase
MDHDGGSGRDEALHSIRIKSGQLAELAGGLSARVNSSHHQSVDKPGHGLRVAARTPDGVIEALEWTGGPGWALGVQWHPERMPGEPFAAALFRRLVKEANGERKTPKSRSGSARRRVGRRKSSR